MVGVLRVEVAQRQIEALEGVGYEWRGETVPCTLYLRKAEPRRFNLHMTQWEGKFWINHLPFRDFLLTHPEIARQYERLKRELMARLASDPPAYNAAKTSFIESIVQQARRCPAGTEVVELGDICRMTDTPKVLLDGRWSWRRGVSEWALSRGILNREEVLRRTCLGRYQHCSPRSSGLEPPTRIATSISNDGHLPLLAGFRSHRP